MHFRASLVGSDPRREPPENTEPVETAARYQITRLVDGHPNRRGIGRRKLKVTRKHAHDGGWFAVDMDDAPNDVGISAKFGAPEAIGENGDMRAVGLHFVLEEVTSEGGLNAERREETRCHLRCESVLRFSGGCHCKRIAAVGREGLDALGRVLPIQVVRIGYLSAARAVVRLRARLAQVEKLAGFAIG